MSYSDILGHIVGCLEPCVTLVCSEPCHIQNPGLFRTQDIFRTPSRHILAYSELCVTLIYLGPELYSESCLFRHIQIYSDIFNNDSYNNIDFLFFTLILHTFQRNLKRHVFFDYSDVHFNARPGLLKKCAIVRLLS